MPHRSITGLRIGFVSTRFDSTDGVTLETMKWHKVLTRLGNECFFFAGACECPDDRAFVVPEAHFRHPEIRAIYEESFSRRERAPETTRKIHLLRDHLKEHLYAYVRTFDLDLLIVENALAIPLNLPLGLALTEFIAETGFPVIAHHHDFFWERKRFLTNCVWDYLNMAFPPHLPTVQHVVINSSAANQLSLRTGISAALIPNVMDFDNPPPPPDEYTANLRADLGVAPDEYFFLQPTRVVRRKGIEHAIELVKRMRLKARLVISHASGDEGHEYEQRVRAFAEMLGVPVNFEAEIIRERRGRTPDGRKVYALWDVYPHADIVTYPSLLEGFGNAFLEAIYFRRPIVVNNYTIYAIDIKPKGFRAIEFDGYITEQTVEEVCSVLENPSLAEEMAEHNYALGKRYYSFTALEHNLRTLLYACFGTREEE
ncbi:MAG: glycosyltransferase [Anaerolineae bacterium]|nr:MAG: glycosyltransferase [Anaerolineae bacterium]